MTQPRPQQRKSKGGQPALRVALAAVVGAGLVSAGSQLPSAWAAIATTSVATCAPGSVILTPTVALNAGGQQVQAQGRTWSADTVGTGGFTATTPSTADIAGTTADALYRSQRVGKQINYAIAVPNGTYIVRLHLAETYWNAPNGSKQSPGSRVFNLNVENRTVLHRYDPAADAGGPMRAAVRGVETTVSDGTLHISATAVVDNASVSAVEALRLSTCGQGAPQPSPAPTSTAPTSATPTSGVPSAPTSTAPTSTGPTSTQPDPTTFTLGQRPFLASSSWNTPVPASASFTKMGWPAPSANSMYWVNWESYAPAIYQAAPEYPVVQVSVPNSWGWPAGQVPVRLPVDATGAVGTDGELLAIDGTTVHNFWQFKRTSPTTATASAYGRTDLLTGSGWSNRNPQRGAGIVASGSSQLAGLLVKKETDAGPIRHALQLAVSASLHSPGYTGEATSGDGTSSAGISKTGQRMAIPPRVAIPAGLSPLGQQVAQALKTYGAFDIDTGGPNTTLLRAQANAYDSATINALRKDMAALLPLLHRVD